LASIYEGLDEMLTVIRLLPAQLRRSLGCNAIESLMAVLRQVCSGTSNAGAMHGWHCDGPEPQCWKPRELPAFEGARTIEQPDRPNVQTRMVAR
jgi:hypothetical protein